MVNSSTESGLASTSGPARTRAFIMTSPTKVPCGNLGRIGETRDIDYNHLCLMNLRGQDR